jgi:hypothetical protein
VRLPDLQFGSGRCATNRRWGNGDPQYRLAEQWGEEFTIRYLAMPHHVECCTYPAPEWIAEHVSAAPVKTIFAIQAAADIATDTPRSPVGRPPPSSRTPGTRARAGPQIRDHFERRAVRHDGDVHVTEGAAEQDQRRNADALHPLLFRIEL